MTTNQTDAMDTKEGATLTPPPAHPFLEDQHTPYIVGDFDPKAPTIKNVILDLAS